MEESNSKPSETQEPQRGFETVELKICVNEIGSLVVWTQYADRKLTDEEWNMLMTNVMNYTKELIYDMQRKRRN